MYTPTPSVYAHLISTVLTASSATRSAMPSKRPWTAIPRLSFLAIAILRSDVLSVIIDAIYVVCCLAGCLSSAMMSSLQMIHLLLYGNRVGPQSEIIIRTKLAKSAVYYMQH